MSSERKTEKEAGTEKEKGNASATAPSAEDEALAPASSSSSSQVSPPPPLIDGLKRWWSKDVAPLAVAAGRALAATMGEDEGDPMEGWEQVMVAGGNPGEFGGVEDEEEALLPPVVVLSEAEKRELEAQLRDMEEEGKKGAGAEAVGEKGEEGRDVKTGGAAADAAAAAPAKGTAAAAAAPAAVPETEAEAATMA